MTLTSIFNISEREMTVCSVSAQNTDIFIRTIIAEPRSAYWLSDLERPVRIQFNGRDSRRADSRGIVDSQLSIPTC